MGSNRYVTAAQWREITLIGVYADTEVTERYRICVKKIEHLRKRLHDEPLATHGPQKHKINALSEEYLAALDETRKVVLDLKKFTTSCGRVISLKGLREQVFSEEELKNIELRQLSLKRELAEKYINLKSIERRIQKLVPWAKDDGIFISGAFYRV